MKEQEWFYHFALKLRIRAERLRRATESSGKVATHTEEIVALYNEIADDLIRLINELYNTDEGPPF